MSHRSMDQESDTERRPTRRTRVDPMLQRESCGAASCDDSAWEASSDPLQQFADAGHITEVVCRVKSGKEATVYCCRAHPATGHALLAAKIYEPHGAATYRLRPTYAHGRDRASRPDARARRAVRAKGRFGQALVSADWIGQEFDNLRLLHRAGARVPQPILHGGSGILMEFIGVAGRPAPMLIGATLSQDAAARLYDQAMASIRLFLAQDRIHGDLSPYNMLLGHGGLVIIDLPQMVLARWNDHAFDVLRRDVENVVAFFARYGVRAAGSASDLAVDLWSQYQRAEL